MKTDVLFKRCRPVLMGLVVLGFVLGAGCSSSGKKTNPTADRSKSTSLNATNAAAGTVAHTLAAAQPGVPVMQISLPSQYTLEQENGKDFTVFYLRDRKQKAGLGIYVGITPSYHHQRDPYLNVRLEKGPLGSREVDWHRYENKGGFFSETLVRDAFKALSKTEGDALSKLKLHYFLAAPNPVLLRELEAAAGKMTVKEP